MSAYNQYLEEIKKLDEKIKQKQIARQLEWEKFVQSKSLILSYKTLLVNFKGVTNELKSLNQYDFMLLKSSFITLNDLNKNILEIDGKIKTSEFQKKLKDLVNYFYNKMVLTEINDSLVKSIKKIQSNDERDQFKNTATKRGELFVKGNIALDPNTDLMWMTYSLENKTKKYCFGGALVEIENFNKNGGCAGYTDWNLPRVEEFKTLEKALSLKKIAKKNKIFLLALIVIPLIFIMLPIFLIGILNNSVYIPVIILIFVTTYIIILIAYKSIHVLPITNNKEYWTRTLNGDKWQVCYSFKNKIISFDELKSKKYHVTLVRKF